MAELICRSLRDGGLDGEEAPALTINDEIDCPLGSSVFGHVFLQLSSFVSSQKSRAKGIVLVAFSRSPLYYEQLLKRNGIDVAGSRKWLSVLDCYTDPLGWKSKLAERGIIKNSPLVTSLAVTSCKSIKCVDALLSSILELGREICVDAKGRFIVGMDCVSDLLRHVLVIAVSSLINSLRNHDRVSSLFWLLHSDLQETRATAAVEYASSMKATIEPMVKFADSSKLNEMEQNLTRGKLLVRVKHRNGRVKLLNEQICVTNSGITFTSLSSEDIIAAQSLVPAVQFNLELSEKERNDREKVVLPFEHQGNGGKLQIYDGRRSLNEGKSETQCSSVEKEAAPPKSGEIIYYRDSDDEMPDSDEDPDDDLDI